MKGTLLQKQFTYGGLAGELKEVPYQEIDSIIASPDFYIRQSLNKAHVEALKDEIQKGEELPPVVIAFVKELEGYRIINGNHTAKAHVLLKRNVQCLDLGELDFEKAIQLQADLNHQGKLLSLSSEDLKAFAIKLYQTFRSEKLGKKDRKTTIEKISLYLRKAERTVYHYLKETLDAEDEMLRKKAEKLYEEGWTQEKIAEELGVAQRTVSEWLSVKSQKSESVSLKLEIFANIAKTSNDIVSQNLKITNQLRDLLEQYYSQDKTRLLKDFPEWAKKQGYEVDEQEYGTFVNKVAFLRDKVLYLYALKDFATLKKVFIEELKNINLGKETINYVISTAEKHLNHFQLRIKKGKKLLQEICDDLNIVDVRGEFIARARKERLFIRDNDIDYFMANFVEDLEECKRKYPTLTYEEIEPEHKREVYYKFSSKAELYNELMAVYYNYRIPEEVVEKLWQETKMVRWQEIKEALEKCESLEELEKLVQSEKEILVGHEKEVEKIRGQLREKEEKRFVESVVEGIKAIEWKSVDEIMGAFKEEERAILVKNIAILKRAFAELPRPDKERIKAEVEKEKAYDEVFEGFRKEGLYLSKEEYLKVREEWIKQKEEEAIKERKRLEEEKKKAEEERRKAEEERRKAEEEKRKIEEERRKAEEEKRKAEEEKRKLEEERRKLEEEKRKIEKIEAVEGKILEGRIVVLDDEEEKVYEDELSDILSELGLTMDTEETKGIGLKGILRELEGIRKQVEELKKEVETLQDKRAKERILNKTDKLLEKIEKVSTKVSISLSKKQNFSKEVVSWALSGIKRYDRLYQQHVGSPLPTKEKKRGILEFAKLLAEEEKAKRNLKEVYKDLKDAMDAQFQRHRDNGFKDLVYLTPADLAINFARYLASAREEVKVRYSLQRIMEESEVPYKNVDEMVEVANRLFDKKGGDKEWTWREK